MAIWLLESLPRAAQPPGTCIFTSCVKLTIGLLCIVGMMVGLAVVAVVGIEGTVVGDGHADGTSDGENVWYSDE